MPPLLRRSFYGLSEPLPASVAADQDEWETRFARFGRAYRRLTLQMWVLFGAGMALMLTGYLVPELRLWAGLPGFALTMATLVPYARLPRLCCPRCSDPLERVVKFCPTCGADGVVVDPRTETRCAACGEVLQPRTGARARGFTIHFCTGCGVLVDRLGV